MCDKESGGGEGEGVCAHWWRCDSVPQWSEEQTI